MSFGLPALAGPVDEFMDALVDVYGHSDAVGDGGVGTGTGTFDCLIDDTTATSPAGTSGAATFRINEDTADNTLAKVTRPSCSDAAPSRGNRPENVPVQLLMPTS